MEAVFRICERFVVSEVIDDEAVIMDLRSGNYFSATGAGGPIWRDLEAKRSYHQILQRLANRYRLPAAALKPELDSFLAELLAHELVETVPTDIESENGPIEYIDTAGDETGPAFEPPVLAMHTDMQDLLLLDPIHDVDMAGWPVRKA